MAKPILTPEFVRERLNYNQETGEFFWKIRPSNNTRDGQVAGAINPKGYRIIKINWIGYKAHRLAWLYVHGVWPIKDIDHINGIKHDNRIANLREVTTSENSQNRRHANANGTSGFLGVHWQPAYKCWIACIGVNGKRKTIGRYKTAIEASEAYLAEKRLHHKGCTI